MIFVTLGTQDKPFERFLKLIEKHIKNGDIKDKVVVQAGYTKFSSDKMEIIDYVPTDKFNKLISECDLLITHGGIGNILMGLKCEKKIIAMARLAKYGEHTNDHQLQIVDNFYENGYILKVENDDLESVLKKIKKFVPKKLEFNNENFIEKLCDYIDNN